MKSELLFGPPLVRGVRASRMTESRTELWRAARDFALCLVDAGSRVTRYLKHDLHTGIVRSRLDGGREECVVLQRKPCPYLPTEQGRCSGSVRDNWTRRGKGEDMETE